MSFVVRQTVDTETGEHVHVLYEEYLEGETLQSCGLLHGSGSDRVTAATALDVTLQAARAAVVMNTALTHREDDEDLEVYTIKNKEDKGGN